MLLALMLQAQAAPLTLRITDPHVFAVVLECGEDVQRAVVRQGVATFAAVPNNCTVDLIRRVSRIDNPGSWTCSLDGCTLDDVHHAPISNAPGRLNVVLTGDLLGTVSLELTCPSGFRARAEIAENTSVFNGLPSEDCTLFFKGGPPARYPGIQAGTWYCHLSGGSAVCDAR